MSVQSSLLRFSLLFFLLLLPMAHAPPPPYPDLHSSTNPLTYATENHRSSTLSCQELSFTTKTSPHLSCQELFPVEPSFEFDISVVENYRDHSHYFHRNPPEIQLIHAISELRQIGFGILALAIDLRLSVFVGLNNFTVFAPDDDAIFSGAEGFVRNFEFHVVPGMRLAFSDLTGIAVGTELTTMDAGRNLVVTGNGMLFSLNNLRLKNPDVFYNGVVSVHEISIPFLPDSSNGSMEKNDSLIG